MDKPTSTILPPVLYPHVVENLLVYMAPLDTTTTPLRLSKSKDLVKTSQGGGL